ncbi:MAG: hypothetical protein WBV69_14185 [Candidatus Sulfotelmatobacter sp.]
MKRILVVTLLLMSFAAVAFADGPGLPPVKTAKPPMGAPVLLADGPDLPPVKTAKPPKLENAA